MIPRTPEELEVSIRDCQLCPSGTKELGWGPYGKIMFIGQCPAFSNTDGKQGTSNFDLFFLDWLSDVNLTKDDFYFTNLVKVPTYIKKLTIEQIDHCLRHVGDEIMIVKPKLIITLGQLAHAWLMKTRFHTEPMMHPAAVKYGRVDRKGWIEQLKQKLIRHNLYAPKQ